MSNASGWFRVFLAVVEDAKARGLKKGAGGQGEIACPLCDGVVRYRVAANNGHLAAACSTESCVRFMQ